MFPTRAMARVHQGLVSAANYHHGTYRKAVIAAGLDYDSLRHKPVGPASRSSPSFAKRIASIRT